MMFVSILIDAVECFIDGGDYYGAARRVSDFQNQPAGGTEV